ncbi:hypothetical protein, partial [Devosia sp.]|uniref:hypothetical protein n=1 Tax=Devosia sp. TaxID=1871048 RepID=UPI002EE7A88E
MKLTWFGGTAIRLHVGGRIFVADAGQAPATVARHELLSGADAAFALATADEGLPRLDPAGWRPRPAPRPLDEAAAPAGPALYRIGAGAVLVDVPGEPA